VKCVSALFSSQYEILCNILFPFGDFPIFLFWYHFLLSHKVLYLLCSILSSFCDFCCFLFWYCFLSFVTILFLLHFVKNKKIILMKTFKNYIVFEEKKVHIFFLLLVFSYLFFYFCSLSYISRYMWLLIVR